jgi:hypothetical protein
MIVRLAIPMIVFVRLSVALRVPALPVKGVHPEKDQNDKMY